MAHHYLRTHYGDNCYFPDNNYKIYNRYHDSQTTMIFNYGNSCCGGGYTSHGCCGGGSFWGGFGAGILGGLCNMFGGWMNSFASMPMWGCMGNFFGGNMFGGFSLYPQSFGNMPMMNWGMSGTGCNCGCGCGSSSSKKDDVEILGDGGAGSSSSTTTETTTGGTTTGGTTTGGTTTGGTTTGGTTTGGTTTGGTTTGGTTTGGTTTDGTTTGGTTTGGTTTGGTTTTETTTDGTTTGGTTTGGTTLSFDNIPVITNEEKAVLNDLGVKVVDYSNNSTPKYGLSLPCEITTDTLNKLTNIIRGKNIAVVVAHNKQQRGVIDHWIAGDISEINDNNNVITFKIDCSNYGDLIKGTYDVTYQVSGDKSVLTTKDNNNVTGKYVYLCDLGYGERNGSAQYHEQNN